ncbi:BON domain-containing protein [Pedobacter sp. N36a]|uniref:BON domain-containing protein n=1 Tax=Pedobacter sp. N36a TaxID=2767996 RepID=UPI00165753FC|nr:BON domain-containing protein [Pedobacter sp. N36a]MBC8987767.1 BON domain-containing protein [Pedobacter sp. N36a]
MKKLMSKMMALVIATAFMVTAIAGCKSTPKDADLKTAVETAIQSSPNLSASGVAVDKGVVTITGQVTDEASKDALGKAAAAVPGVKSVVNNLTIEVAKVEVTADTPLALAVKDATKDFPTVAATVNDGVVTLKGELKKADLQKLMMAVNALKPKKVDNQLVIK